MSWVTQAILEFKSNGAPLLAKLTLAANDLSASLERVQLLSRGVGPSMAGMNRSVGNLIPKLGAQRDLINANAVALERYNLAARAGRGAVLPGSGVGGRGGAGGDKEKGGGGFGLGTAAGIAAAVTMYGGVEGAANVQSALNNLATQLGRTPEQMKAMFLPLAVSISNKTARSLPEELGLISTLATFVKDPKALKKLAPTTATLADVLYLSPQKMPFEDTAAQFGRIAHQLNIFRDPKQLSTVADMYYRLALSSPDRANKLVTQLGYFGHSYRGAGVSPTDTMNLLLWGDLAIGSGKYGAGLGRVLSDLAAPSREKLAGQMALGLRDRQGNLIPGAAVDGKGNFTPIQLMNWIATREKGHTGIQRTSDVERAFNLNAARTISNMTSPQSLDRLDRLSLVA